MSKTKDQPTLVVEDVDINSVVEDPENARLHSERNLADVRRSLERFGQRKSIVVRRRDRVVIAGNATLLMARDLGWSKISVAWTDLEGEEATAYALADNQTPLSASWDVRALQRALDSIKTEEARAATGFSPDELARLLGRAELELPTADPSGEFAGGGDGLDARGFTILVRFPPERIEDAAAKERVTRLCEELGLTADVRMGRVA